MNLSWRKAKIQQLSKQKIAKVASRICFITYYFCCLQSGLPVCPLCFHVINLCNVIADKNVARAICLEEKKCPFMDPWYFNQIHLLNFSKCNTRFQHTNGRLLLPLQFRESLFHHLLISFKTPHWHRHFSQDLDFVDFLSCLLALVFAGGSACVCALSVIDAAAVWGPLVATSAFCSLSCRMSVSRSTSWIRLAKICSFVDFSAEFSDMKILCGEGQTYCK